MTTQSYRNYEEVSPMTGRWQPLDAHSHQLSGTELAQKPYCPTAVLVYSICGTWSFDYGQKCPYFGFKHNKIVCNGRCASGYVGKTSCGNEHRTGSLWRHQYVMWPLLSDRWAQIGGWAVDYYGIVTCWRFRDAILMLGVWNGQRDTLKHSVQPVATISSVSGCNRKERLHHELKISRGMETNTVCSQSWCFDSWKRSKGVYVSQQQTRTTR